MHSGGSAGAQSESAGGAGWMAWRKGSAMQFEWQRWDMWEPYRGIVQAELPHAEIVADRFHDMVEFGNLPPFPPQI